MKKLCILFALLLVFTGCSASQEKTAPVEEQTPAEEAAVQTVVAADPVAEDERDDSVLTIAGLDCADSSIRLLVNAYNNQSDGRKIQLVDYMENVESAEQGLQKLTTEILAGNCPDMFLFENLSPLPYLTKGLLVDLDTELEADASYTAGDFIIWDALHEFDGMYVISPQFVVNTVYCTQETADRYQNWTLDDYLTIEESLSEDQALIYYMTPEAFIRRIGSRYVHKAVDFQTASCDFDNAEFISLLDAAARAESYQVSEWHTQADGSFKSAPQMMLDGTLLSCYVKLNSAVDVSFDRFRTDGERFAYIGWPTPDGSCGSDIELVTPLGICSASAHVSECWDFIKYVLENPVYQDAYSATPTLRSHLAENLQSIKTHSKELNWDTEQEDLDALVALAEQCQNMTFDDEALLQIMQEEAANVFSGQITSATAAANIQKRVSILLSEQYG